MNFAHNTVVCKRCLITEMRLHGMQDLLSSRPATQQTFVHAPLNEMNCLVAALMAGSCAARRH